MDEADHIALIRERVRAVPDFPKPGILFRDITTVLADAEAWRITIDRLADAVGGWQPDVVVGIESRGFILGAALAYRLGLGFVPIRKPGKLPHHVHATSYDLEYGSDTLEIHTDAIGPGHRAAVVDDLLATGGTARAAIDLVHACGGAVAGVGVLIELLDLRGRDRVPAGVPLAALLAY
jgi:adenine phosphoribosyltransferase